MRRVVGVSDERGLLLFVIGVDPVISVEPIGVSVYSIPELVCIVLNLIQAVFVLRVPSV